MNILVHERRMDTYGLSGRLSPLRQQRLTGAGFTVLSLKLIWFPCVQIQQFQLLPSHKEASIALAKRLVLHYSRVPAAECIGQPIGSQISALSRSGPV